MVRFLTRGSDFSFPIARVPLPLTQAFPAATLAFTFPTDPRDAADDGAGEFEAGLDHEVERLVDRLLQGLDDLADLRADAADVDYVGQEPDDDRDHLAEYVVDLVHDPADVAADDVGDGVDDGVDELGDPGRVVDEEHDDVVDQLAGFNERGGRVEQADQPRDAGGDDPGDHEVVDLRQDRLLDVAELVDEQVPQAGDALAGDGLEDRYALLGCRHRLLADLLHEAVADIGPRQPEDRRQQLDDTLGVEGVG